MSDELRSLYEGDMLSTTQIARRIGTNRSAVRRMLLNAGITLRSPADGMRLRVDVIAAKNREKKVPMTDEWKQNIRTAALRRGEQTAVGISHKASGYVEHTRGPHKGRSVHVVIMEDRLGRPLLEDELVHHIDGDRSNNEPNNLALLTRSGHARLHRREEILANNLRERTENGRFR